MIAVSKYFFSSSMPYSALLILFGPSYEKGKVISGLEKVKDALVFHAGAKQSGDEFVTSGGRVMAVTTFGTDHKEALKLAYKEVSKITFEGINFRKDLGFDL